MAVVSTGSCRSDDTDAIWLVMSLVERGDVSFISKPASDLYCSICLSLAIDPVVTESCGHLYCRSCISTSLERKRECPIDRKPLKLQGLRTDLRARRSILGLGVRCLYDSCTWKGDLSGWQSHYNNCPFAVVPCPFSVHGCTARITRKEAADHLSTATTAHMSLLCTAVRKLSDEAKTLWHTIDVLRSGPIDPQGYVWVIPDFLSRRGPLYSPSFTVCGHGWYVGIDIDVSGGGHMVGVFLFAEGHSNRVNFQLSVINRDPTKRLVHHVKDWATEYKGKGWGPVNFLDGATLRPKGFVVDGFLRLVVELLSEPFE